MWDMTMKEFKKYGKPKWTKEQVRLNWIDAIKTEVCIAAAVEYGLTLQDLIVLGSIHKNIGYEDEIEDLLSECGFERERDYLRDESYVEYADQIFNEYA